MRTTPLEVTYVAALGLLVLACASRMAPPMLLINESPSLPRGLYVRQFGAPPARGDVVAAAAPAIARPYLRELGRPDDALLLKRIAATAGDRVCALGDQIDAPWAHARRLETDRLGRSLPAWSGCIQIPSDQVFLLGESPTSFDSRYFGPVETADLHGVFLAVLTW